MASNSTRTENGKKVTIHRAYTDNGDLSATQYLPSTQFSIGINQADVAVTDTEMTMEVPIDNGTVNDDGSNTLTGSSGGDNSTDNTTTFKPGAGVFDVTAQNLIANGTNATKIWTIADLSSAGTNITGTDPFGLWLYIKDAAALAKFLSAGTSIEIKFGSDSSNYYSKTFATSDVAVGWNWLTSNAVAVNGLSETGTVTGNIDTFIIEVTTNNAADAFVAGDVIYDLLRQWDSTDLVKDFEAGYPQIDLNVFEATMKCFLPATQANGFDINGLSLKNKDTSVLMTDIIKFPAESKASTDEFVFFVKNRHV